jgi:hypothetical protein
MNTLRILVLFTLISGGVVSCLSAEDYHQLIRNFAANTSRNKIQSAVKAIKDAGTNAFPALLAHLKDKAPAEISFFGGDNILPPTIGTACFNLLQGQVEGVWPKGYRDYHTLSPKTVRDWIARNQGLSLQQLRVEAAQQSLARAEADSPKKPDSDFHKRILGFLRKNLEEAKQNAAQ